MSELLLTADVFQFDICDKSYDNDHKDCDVVCETSSVSVQSLIQASMDLTHILTYSMHCMHHPTKVHIKSHLLVL